jgi:hypothetical protein
MTAYGEPEGIRREQVWPILRYNLGICLQDWGKQQRTSVKIVKSMRKDLYQVPPRYKSEALLLETTCLVERICDAYFPSNASVNKNYKLITINLVIQFWAYIPLVQISITGSLLNVATAWLYCHRLACPKCPWHLASAEKKQSCISYYAMQHKHVCVFSWQMMGHFRCTSQWKQSGNCIIH